MKATRQEISKQVPVSAKLEARYGFYSDLFVKVIDRCDARAITGVAIILATALGLTCLSYFKAQSEDKIVLGAVSLIVSFLLLRGTAKQEQSNSPELRRSSKDSRALGKPGRTNPRGLDNGSNS